MIGGRKIFEGARVGHRYNCLMVLTTYAMKCSMYDEKHNPEPVTYEELEKTVSTSWDIWKV